MIAIREAVICFVYEITKIKVALVQRPRSMKVFAFGYHSHWWMHDYG